MILQIIPEGGIGQRPIVLKATQVVVMQDNGTPIYVCGHYGPSGAYAHAKAGDPDFNRMLQTLGINMTVVVDRIELAKVPTGAKLVAGPKS